VGLNAIRVAIKEARYTIRSTDLANALLELDSRISGADCFLKIIRSDGVITNAKFYSDPEKTILCYETFFDNVSGADGIVRPVGVSSFYYNTDMSTDSVVSGGIDRQIDEPYEIESCSGFFYTDEDTGCS